MNTDYPDSQTPRLSDSQPSPTMAELGRKGRPTLRLHATKEKMENAQHLLQLAMHRYFGGRNVSLPPLGCRGGVAPPLPPPPATEEWEYLLKYTQEAHTVPKSDIEAVINVYNFKLVDGPDGVSIEAEATCYGCGMAVECCDCHLHQATTALVDEVQDRDWGDEPEEAQENTDFKSQWETYGSWSMGMADKAATMSCLAPAFVPGAVPLQEPTTVDWSWCPEVPSQRVCTSWRPLTPPPAPVGTNRRRSSKEWTQSRQRAATHGIQESPYSHIRETADASYQPTVGELALSHCTFCKNSGEPYAVYRGHTVRGSTGEVECHKLLSIECLRCHQRGHTVSHCTGLPPPPPPPPPTPEAELYCQFCFTSGEDEEAYRSHNLRDADGTTNCQKLLNIQCRNCGKLGHTQRYCDQERKQTFRRGRFQEDRQRHSRAPSPFTPPDVSNHRDFPSLLPPPLAPDTPEPIPRSS